VCQQSLIKTIAAKHKHKKKSSWVYRRYIYRLDDGRKVIRVIIPRKEPKKPLVATFGVKPIRYVKTAILKDEVSQLHFTRTELVQRLLADKCELCDSTKNVEVHHVHKLADIKKKYKGRKLPPKWVMFMISRNRKTIVVCRECHHKIHTGTYDGSKLN
jgi:hypothetical protein